jgi:hypothetical protein
MKPEIKWNKLHSERPILNIFTHMQKLYQKKKEKDMNLKGRLLGEGGTVWDGERGRESESDQNSLSTCMKKL